MGGLWYIKRNFDFGAPQQWFSSQSLDVFPTDVRVVLKLEKHVPAQQTRRAPVREKFNLSREQRQTILEALSLEP